MMPNLLVLMKADWLQGVNFRRNEGKGQFGMPCWSAIENWIKELELQGELVAAPPTLIDQLRSIGAPGGYIGFVERNGVGPLKKLEQPFYWLELFEGLQSFEQIWGHSSDRHADWKFFATSLGGECYAMRRGHPDKVWWMDAASEPSGFFCGGLIDFFDNHLSCACWELSGSKEPKPSLDREFVSET